MCKQDTFVVDVRSWNCTCRVWDLTGIPCPYAACVILYREERLEDYVLDLYKTHVYNELYSAAMPTVPSEKFWENTKIGYIDPPLKRKLLGRPKHKRKREDDRGRNGNKLRKLGLKMSGRKCGHGGHNKRTCKNKNQTNVEIQDAHMESNVEGSRNGSPIASQSTPSVQPAPSCPTRSSTPRKKVTANRIPPMTKEFRGNVT